jgi:Predicted nucleotide-binding protein containing TIR -like domain
MTKSNQLLLLDKLIKEGKTYELKSSSTGLGSYFYQTDFLSWYNQVTTLLRSIDFPFSDSVGQIGNDKQLNQYDTMSIVKILAALKSAYRILETQQIMNTCIENSSDKTYENLETRQITSPSIEIASDNKLDFIEEKVFIVHGHDTGLRETVARYIEHFGIKPIILQEQTGNNQTIIEKLETNSDVKFAIVLLTPDDIGSAMSENDFMSRARQNVILELGYFFGKLGRANVRALYDENVELPSDIIGIEYIKIDSSDAWKLKLAKEMKQCGLKIDMNKL